MLAFLGALAFTGAPTFAQRCDLPWCATFMDIEGGTHAASLPEVYRRAMLAIFPPETD